MNSCFRPVALLSILFSCALPLQLVAGLDRVIQINPFVFLFPTGTWQEGFLLADEEFAKQEEAEAAATNLPNELSEGSESGECIESNEEDPLNYQGLQFVEAPVNQSPLPIRFTPPPKKQSRKPACKYYKMGDCWKGDDCPFRHVRK